MTDINISKSPADYYSWVECLKKLKTGIPDTDTLEILGKGICPEYAGIKASMHQLIEDAVNAIIANCIRELKRDIAKYADSNEIDGFHMAFKRFGKRINGCMFFTKMSFLDESYRKELTRETIRQISRFWTDTIDRIKADTAARDNVRMAEELFLINRIRLFLDYQFSE